MRYHCFFLILTCLAIVALGSPVVPVPDPSQVPWTRLSYKAAKLFLSATSDVRLESLAGTTAARDLIATPGHRELAPPSSTSLLVLDSLFLGRSSSSRVWFDPRLGHALQRLRLRDGKDPYQKTYRFTHGGTYAERRSPNDEREVGRQPEGWSRVHGQFYPYPVELMDCTAIVEPATLLYLIAATPIPPDSSMELCAFADKSFRRVSVRHEGEELLGVDYVVRSSAGDEVRRGEISVERYSVRSLPLLGDDDNFEMLGLEGDLEIFLEPRSRLPVQVSGRVPKFGHVDVKLRQAELR